MEDQGPQPRPSRPRLLAWWEGLESWGQARIAFPPLAVGAFLVNARLWNQPTANSLFYAVFEGGLVTGALLMATANERNKRA